MSGLRGWWVDGDSRLIRTFALALAVAVAATQLLAGYGLFDLGKSVYLLPSFSVPLMFAGGILFGYGMVLANGCGSRALVLLGRGNLRSFVVVIVLGIAAQMTLRGLIAPARVALLQASLSKPALLSLPALLAGVAGSESFARPLVASVMAAALISFAFAHAPFRRSGGQIAAGIAVGLLVTAGWYATGYLGADDFNPTAVTSLTFIAPIADTRAIRHAVHGADAEFRHRDGRRCFCREPADSYRHAPLSSGRLHIAPPHAAFDHGCGADGVGWCDGARLLGWPGIDRAFDTRAFFVRRCRRDPARLGSWPARAIAGAAAGSARRKGKTESARRKRKTASRPKRRLRPKCVMWPDASRRGSRAALPSA